MLVTYFINFRKLNDHLFGKELLIQFTTSAFRKLLSVYVFDYFPFGFEGRMWDLIVSFPDHCSSFYFTLLFFSRNGSTAVPILHEFQTRSQEVVQNKGVVRCLLGSILILYRSEVS